jgi:hypothetical protein
MRNLVIIAAAALFADVSVDMGPPSVVLPNGAHGLYYFSDEPVSILGTNPLRYLVVAGERTFLMAGSSFESAAPVSKALEPSNAPGSYDEHYAGISSVYQAGGEILGFFHAERRTGGKDEHGVHMFYSMIGLAVSNDGGKSFHKKGPIISGAPYDPNRKFHQGNGDVSVCAVGDWLHAYYTIHDKRGSFTCLARSKINDKGMPGTWKKYFEGSFGEPGLGGRDTQVAGCWGPNVISVPAAKKHLLLGGHDGLALFLSDDGIKWTPGQTIWKITDYPKWGHEIATHPTIVVSKATSKKVEGWLFFGYSPRWGYEAPFSPHFLVKRPIKIEFDKEPKRKTNPSGKPYAKQKQPANAPKQKGQPAGKADKKRQSSKDDKR